MSQDPYDRIEEMLASMFGPEIAGNMVEEMRRAGIDPHLISASGMPAGGMMGAAIPGLLSGAMAGPDNVWRMARDFAITHLQHAGSHRVTAAEAEQVRHALQIADLWLDAVTDMLPAPGPREAWTERQWVERSFPTWRMLSSPIIDSASDMMIDTLKEATSAAEEQEGISSMLGGDSLAHAVRPLMQVALSSQVAGSIAENATHVLSAGDSGLPLREWDGTALVVPTANRYAAELDSDDSEVMQFLAVREAAAARLFTRVPWLRGQITTMIDSYSRQVRENGSRMQDLLSTIDTSDPLAVNTAIEQWSLGEAHTDAQRALLERLEGLLALIEGWVEVVTQLALAPHMPRSVALSEMIRRHRINGSPAALLFHRLVGMPIRPQLARDAAQLWRYMTTELGVEGRDALWSHPDVMPTTADLADPAAFLTRRRAEEHLDADVDAELASLLDGTLGWAGEAQPSDPSSEEGSDSHSSSEDEPDTEDEPHTD